MIDLPPETYYHAIRDNLRLDELSAALITHNHADHLYTPELRNRKRGYAHFGEGETPPPLMLYAAESGYRAISEEIEAHKMHDRCEVSLVTPLRPFTVDSYTVMPYPAAHIPATSPVLYSITEGEKSFLYAHDTGYFPEQTWEALRQIKKPFQLVSLDCTCQDTCREHHMGLSTALEVLERMKREGVIDRSTVRVLHHFSHNGGYSYKELQEKVAPLGILVSYDGMEIEF